MRACHNNSRLGGVQVDVENLIDHFFGDPAKPNSKWIPRAEVLESDTGFRLIVELPGVSKEQVSLEMKENQLVIAGQKQFEELEEGFKIVRRERQSGGFHRAFEFASMIDADKVTAEFKQGVLTVSIPKSEKVLPRKIEIAIGE